MESSGAKHKDDHGLVPMFALIDHVMPSKLVIMLVPVPELETAQKMDNSCDQTTDCQFSFAAAVRAVHVIPSGDVITRSLMVPAVESETAQKRHSSGDQHTDVQ